jgi:hypothetical protein
VRCIKGNNMMSLHHPLNNRHGSIDRVVCCSYKFQKYINYSILQIGVDLLSTLIVHSILDDRQKERNSNCVDIILDIYGLVLLVEFLENYKFCA